MSAADKISDHAMWTAVKRSGCSWRGDQQPWVNGLPWLQVQIDGIVDQLRPGMTNRHAVDEP